ncbi:C69 family dipeptidase [Bifidobacterium phasiani]|uniref:membrane dipeptidase n=1 Tax=Bifidobacterium phasiani TaxID=2834431 RepID=A0ABS6W7V2_9BIFI|nr:C69 family dipeptidase [Bifidobacterium phasiani]MBW3082583.1 C69 family dipeptidase [Bifidobacterium phasiani]
MSCTTILIGKHASWDGSTIIARDDDSGSGRYDPKRLVVVHPADQPRHYTSTLSHVEIDLPDDPCRYMIAPNVLPNRGVLAEAGVNVHNVCMTATETLAVNERVLAADPMVELRPAAGTPGDADYTPETPGGIGEEDIITLVLPYVTTARDGVLRLGGLLERYGTYEANGIAISDADEIWYVETIGGHHWIARRVPDDCYTTIPNQLGIDDFDLDDAFGERRDFMCSADLREFMARHHLDMTMRPSGRGTTIGFGAATGGTNGSANGGATASARTAHGTRNAHCAVGTTDTGTTDADITDTVIGTTDPAIDAMPPRRFNPRHAFGTSTPKDHIYNTPRAWYMQRHLNPSDGWDSPAARWTPASDDIPWCRVPERRVSIEDVEFLLASHFEGTPFDPYGTLGTPESRHRYRPIGINRTGHMVAMQVRPDVPAANRALMWVSFGSGPFTAAAPFYANATDTPAYLRDTPAEPSTDSLYWTNRMIAAMADPHYIENSNAIEQYREAVHAFGHRHVFETDEALAQTVGNASATVADAPLGAATPGNAADDSNALASNATPTDNGTPVDNNTPADNNSTAASGSIPTSGMPTNNDAEYALDAASATLTRANEETGDFLRRRTTQLLADVLYTSSNLMRNSFAMSDRWA